MVEQTTMIAFLTQSTANLTICWCPCLNKSSTLTNRCAIDRYSAWLISACICATKSIDGLYSIDCTTRCAVIVVWWNPLLILMTHLHVYSYAENSFWVNCIAKEFTLNIIDQHFRDEDVSNYNLFSIFEIAIFRQSVQYTVELIYRFAFLLFSWEKHIAIKSDVPLTNESYFHHLPELEGSEIVDIVMWECLS